MARGAFERIHHIDSRFNKIFSKPLYYAAMLVTVINFLSPYSLRIALAFLINIFFNRPVVYLSLFAQKIGKKINFIVIGIFYFTVMGLYACAYKFFGLMNRQKNKSSRWITSKTEKSLEDYYYQS